MKDNRQVAIWLYCGAICIFIQIILGGITRLTGSGLSITEWQPLLGTLPPLTEKSWQHSFDSYKQIAQFKIVNSDFSLANYKSIFFWEWLHRNWARLLGLIFIVPFLILIFRKKIERKMYLPLVIVFLLGALQGIIGWIMVKSGLNDTSIAVNEIKLAIHFITALLLLGYTLWLSFKISLPQLTVSPALRQIAGAILAMILLQMFYGALMAGSKAALAAPTWPDMNGYLIPPGLYQPAAGDTYLLVIQFIHRLFAFMIAALICILYKRSSGWKTHPLLSSIRNTSIILISTQIILGAATLLNSFSPAYRIYALLHQVNGLLLFINLLLIVYLTRKKAF